MEPIRFHQQVTVRIRNTTAKSFVQLVDRFRVKRRKRVVEPGVWTKMGNVTVSMRAVVCCLDAEGGRPLNGTSHFGEPLAKWGAIKNVDL